MDDINYIRVPRALDGIEPLALEMTSIRQAESRLQEVAFVNSHRAPELLACFNSGFLATSRYLNLLEFELDVAERRVAEVKAVFLIDKLPALLAEKGLATSRSPLGSEDIRQAFLDRDEDYKRLQNLLCVLRSYIGLFETLQTGFVNGYNSVKRILASDPSSWRQNPNLIQPQPPSDNSGSPGLPGDFMTVTSGPKQIENKITVQGLDDADDFFGTPNK